MVAVIFPVDSFGGVAQFSTQGVITMSTITKRAIRLAVIVEVASCIGMLTPDEPYENFFHTLCDYLGWPSRTVSLVLQGFFCALNFPVVFLMYNLFGSVVIPGYNGHPILTTLVVLIIVVVQGSVWTLVFSGLMHVERRVKLLFRRHDD